MRNPAQSPLGIEEHVRRQLRVGDADEAATFVLETFGPGILAFFSSTLPSDDAQDAFSDFQQAVWRGLPHFRWECPLRAWLHRLARHAVAHVMRDGFRRRRTPLPVDFARVVAAPQQAAPDDTDWSARFSTLGRLLDPEDRRLLALRVARSLPWDEVAAALCAGGAEVTSAGLRKRFERLKTKLACLAREHGMVG